MIAGALLLLFFFFGISLVNTNVVSTVPQFSKQTRISRWRAYAKGCIDLCDKHASKAIEERAKLTDVAPKDVKQLEVLKPIGAPDMEMRFRQSIEKEKRLEVASRPIQKVKPVAKKEENDEEVRGKLPEKADKKRKGAVKGKEVRKKVRVDESDLDQKDTLEEGINWSDDEE